MNIQESIHRDLYEPLRVLGGPKNLQECQRISRSFKLFLGVHKSPYGSPGLFKMPKLSQGVSRSFREPQRMLLYMIFMSVKDSPGATFARSLPPSSIFLFTSQQAPSKSKQKWTYPILKCHFDDDSWILKSIYQ